MTCIGILAYLQPAKGKPRKAAAGQKEMLLPISGKRAAKEDKKKVEKLHVGDFGIDRLHRALGSAVRQLNQSGLDSAVAQFLMSRKSAELEDLMKRRRSNVS
jgi:hypothetical protein